MFFSHVYLVLLLVTLLSCCSVESVEAAVISHRSVFISGPTLSSSAVSSHHSHSSSSSSRSRSRRHSSTHHHHHHHTSSTHTHISVVTTTTTFFTTVVITATAPTNTSPTEGSGSGSLIPPDYENHDSIFTNNPGGIAGLVIGSTFALALVGLWIWFTWRRHRTRQLEVANLSAKSPDTQPTFFDPRLGRRSVLDDDRTMAGLHTSHTIVGSGNRSSVEYDSFWVPRSQNDHYASDDSAAAHTITALSSHGHGEPSTGRTSPMISSQHGHSSATITRPSRPQSPPSAWLGPPLNSASYPGAVLNPSSSLPPSARSSLESTRGPAIWLSPEQDFGPSAGPSSVYLNSASGHSSRRESLQLYASPYVTPPPPAVVMNPPSSLLRPPSTSPPPTDTPIARQPIYLNVPSPNDGFMSDAPSPTASAISVMWGRQGLLEAPDTLKNPTDSSSSLRDHIDYTRRIGATVNNFTRDSNSTTADTVAHPEETASQ